MRFLLFRRTHTRFGRLLKNCAQGRHAVLRRSRQCSHMLEDAALVVLPRALPDDLIPVFQHAFRYRGKGFDVLYIQRIAFESLAPPCFRF